MIPLILAVALLLPPVPRRANAVRACDMRQTALDIFRECEYNKRV